MIEIDLKENEKMGQFVIKLLLLMTTLLFGIILGIQQAEIGILSIHNGAVEEKEAQEVDQSVDSTPAEESTETNTVDEQVSALEDGLEESIQYYIKKIDGDLVEYIPVGGLQQEQKFSLNDLEEKKEKLAEANHHNRYSHIGSRLGDAVYSVSQRGFQWVVNQLDRVL